MILKKHSGNTKDKPSQFTYHSCLKKTTVDPESVHLKWTIHLKIISRMHRQSFKEASKIITQGM